MKLADKNTKLNIGGIAIIGMACRFPGARNLEEFWHNLRNGRESVAYFSDEELAASGINPDMLSDPHYVKAGAILDDVEKFDAEFFGISAAEATLMDPQHRLLLECAWEAFENGGYTPAAIDTAVGVYAGSRISEYMLFNQPTPDLVGLGDGSLITNFQRLVANDKDYLATRISFKLNLTGPSLTVQTACSTSLVAVHLACESLFNAECDLALAGGVSIRVPQKAGHLHSEGMIFSVDGHTRAFDAKASGTIFSSGAGLVLLKRLEEAVADGDHIYAVIRGSAVNNDGAGDKAGYTAPSQAGQAGVIAQAMAMAGVEPETMSYIETHGTGTALGDAIEVAALIDVFQGRTEAKNFCALGAVKCNIGHTVQAAGVAGLIKTALMLKHKVLVSTPNFERPNPELNIDDSPFYINTKLKDWNCELNPRRAGVSSFGVGGTNAHAVLEEAPLMELEPSEGQSDFHLLALSAKNSAALRAMADRYAQHLKATNDSLTDVCFTANVGRAHFPKRLAVLGRSVTEMSQKLFAYAAGQEASGLISIPDEAITHPRIAFLFTGQGSQYIDMGRRLYESQPIFRNALTRCAGILDSYLDQPLLEILYPDVVHKKGRESISTSGEGKPPPSALDQTAVTQPALFALEYSLACLWQSWGVKPDFVMGHSVGEYVAACLAGVFTLENGLRLIAERGRIMQALPAGGVMVSIFADEARVNAAVAPYALTVSIAAINGPNNIVISGLGADVQAIVNELQAEGIRIQLLPVSHAFHSPLMEPLLADFERVARTVDYAAPTIPLISNLTAQQLDKAPNAAYWRQHVRETVLFSAAMQTLCEQGCDILIEIGPQPVLLGMGRPCWPNGAGVWLPSLRKGQSDEGQILQSLAKLYVHQIQIDWAEVHAPRVGRRVPLPTYPFQRQRYWLEPSARQPVRRQAAQTRHPLLGARLASPLPEIQFHSRVSAAKPSFLTEHQLHGTPVFPATAYIEMVHAAASEMFGDKSGVLVIEDFVILEALLLDEKVETTLHLVLRPEGDRSAGFQIFSQSAGETDIWQEHVHGKLNLEPMAKLVTIALDDLQACFMETVTTQDFYQRKRERGLHHGPQFQGVVQIKRAARNGEALAYIDQSDALASRGAYHLTPALLDACLQIGEVAFLDYDDANTDSLYLPLLCDRITIFGRLETPLWTHATSRSPGQGQVRTIDLRVMDASGQALVEIQGLHFKRLDASTLETLADGEDWLHHVAWVKSDIEPFIAQPSTIMSTSQGVAVSREDREGGRYSGNESRALKLEPREVSGEGIWLIFADDGGLGEKIARALVTQGQKCIQVFAGDSWKIGECNYTVNPLSTAEFCDLLDVIGWAGGGLLYLWGLRDKVPDFFSAARLKYSCGGLLHLTQALAARTQTTISRLWIVTRGAQTTGEEFGPVAICQAPLWGMGRVMTRELPDFRPTLIDLDPAVDENEAAALLSILNLKVENAEQQIAIRHNTRYVARLIPSKAKPSREQLGIPSSPYELDTTERGVLDNFRLRSQQRRSPGPNEVEIQVYATGLNFRDVLNALGQLSGHIGRECSGVIVACGEGVRDFDVGDEVVAVFAYDSFSSFVTVKACYVAKKPIHLSFEAAATIPIVFSTAYCCLQYLARVEQAKRILVHAASGGLGLAAVQLAQKAGVEIFGTASRPKWDYLKSLGIQHVLNSRTFDFGNEIMRLTDGAGVDIVLNSLAGEFIPRSISVLRQGGHFIELGATGTWDHTQVAELRPDVTYTPFRLHAFAEQDHGRFQAMFRLLMVNFERGELKPLPYRVFPIDETVPALRTMAQAKHIGKIVISARVHIPERERHATPTITSNKTYLITGGLGGLGLKVAAWLVKQGARNVALVGRSPAKEEAQKAISQIEADGAEIVVVQADVTQPDQVAKTIATIKHSMPPLGGIIHAAGLLDDKILAHQSWESFGAVLSPKVAGTWNLHSATKGQPLDFFALFSSQASLWGLSRSSQAAYAAANSFLDAFANYRRSQGLTAVSVNWGAWAEVGMAANLTIIQQRERVALGHGQIKPGQGLELFKRILQLDESNVAVLPIHWPKFLRQFAVVPPFFSQLQVGKSRSTETAQPTPGVKDILKHIRTTLGADDHRSLTDYVRSEVARLSGVSETTLAVDRSLLELGIDSLMALELRNRIVRNLKVDVPIVKFLEGRSVKGIAELLLQQFKKWTTENAELLKPISVHYQAAENSTSTVAKEEITNLLTEIESLSDTEAQKLASQVRSKDPPS